jgi:type I restriction enzyme S subunit
MSSKTQTTAMKEDATPERMPKLRFPEFRNEPWWEEVSLEQIAERTTTKNHDGSITRVLTNSAEHGVVDQRDYFQKDIANAGNIDGYYIVDLGDYVYNPRISTLAPVGPISRNDIGKGVMSPLYTVFRFTDENTDFYQHYFKTVSWHLYLRRVSSMGARHDRMSITTRDFMAMPVPTPLPQEQQKIAECLSSLDGLITAEGRALEALKAHKKGLMQQLFPEPGQTQPRLRFPEFRDKGLWTLSDLGPMTTKVGSGITPRGGDKNYRKDGRIFIRSQNVGWGVLILDDVAYIDEETHRSFDSTEIGERDVLLNITGASIGRSAVADSRLAGGNVNQHVCIIRTKPNRLHPFLLNQYLISEYGQTQIDSFQAGGNRQGLNFGQIRSFLIPMPPRKAEQERIAACLSALGTLIAAQAAKIESLKQHKRGLMQQLFPAPEGQE